MNNIAANNSETCTPLGALAATWGLCGVILLLASAVYRLSFWTLDSFNYDYNLLQWIIFFGYAVFMAFSEGYRGFQKGFSPRVAARSLYIARNPTLIRTLLAPFFCMGYFGATRKRMIVSWILTIAIIALIIIVRQLPQPWRGIIDFGVVIGLAWGLISLILFAFRAFLDPQFEYGPEVS